MMIAKWQVIMRLGILALQTGAIATFTTPSFAQIAPDETLAGEGSIPIQRSPIDFNIEGGSRRGANLFHSFRSFNIEDGGSVYFANPNGVENIFTRVTGNNISQIQGTLGVSGNANLFLLNPNGIVFGRNARLDIKGSFVATTANAIQLENFDLFSVTAPQNSQLLSIQPGALFFNALPNHQTEIINQGNLAVGKSLTLAAHNLKLQGQLFSGENLILKALDTVQLRDNQSHPFIARTQGQLLVQGNQGIDILTLNHPQSGLFARKDLILRSPSSVVGNAHFWSGKDFRVESLDGTLGNLESVSVPIIQASGDVSFNSYTGTSLQIFAGGSVNIDTVVINGTNPTNNVSETITLSDGKTQAEVNGSTQPTLDIRAGTTAVGSALGMTSNSFDDSNSYTVPTANIDIDSINITQANGLVILTNQYQSHPSASGNIRVKTISTNDFSNGFSGNSGDVVIDSRGDINIPSFGTINTSSRSGKSGDIRLLAKNTISGNNAQIATTSFSSKDSGNVNIQASNFFLTDRAFIDATTFGQGKGGDITMNVAKLIELVGIDGQFNTGIFSETTATGKAGNITINAEKLVIRQGAYISTISSGQGQAGNLSVKTTESVELLGTRMFRAGVYISSGLFTINEIGSQPAGDLTISTRRLIVEDGGQASAETYADGKGGNLTVKATEFVKVAGVSPNGFFTSRLGALTIGKGNAGDLTINTGTLILQNGGQISVTTGGKGNAGNLIIHASEAVELSGKPPVGERLTGLYARVALQEATGKGGQININTPLLSVIDGATIQTTTVGNGDAGNINLNVQNRITLSGKDTGLSANSRKGSIGNSGNIFIDSQKLIIQNGAQILVNSQGNGRGGNIEIAASDVTLNNGTISATTASTRGGDITLNAQDLLLLRNGSQISTTAGTAGAGGDGGNIFINTPFIVAVPQENSDITADAFEGNGGNINILTQGIFGIEPRNQKTSLSDITASSQFGVAGQISINTPDIDPGGGLVELPSTVIDASEQITQNLCQQSVGSTFVVTGRGGLPTNPSLALTPPGVRVGLVEPTSSTITQAQSTNKYSVSNHPQTPTGEKAKMTNPIVEAQGWEINHKGEIMLTAYNSTATNYQNYWRSPTSCSGS
ncbi:filamentous hemagglutinin N-terminal domain-containing protein [Desmonostoc muscorum LEGE 12446]|uniref:Filamentous hemagglutinin N-terminal domain-containing protein n=1 Tax=Desmonostoc muscorum LEGE 12446 TaxID=1828758 RepID=A0A8J7A4H3_DESMC|nr:filamentous hemagglutinin N-terminal domain-containing protein [Desmonostoc muscorum]MCF2146577.1 filamentous hemagglutinin N-terminal domain-containing protein [Desmonostoc muscorum LEGE 12446]